MTELPSFYSLLREHPDMSRDEVMELYQELCEIYHEDDSEIMGLMEASYG